MKIDLKKYMAERDKLRELSNKPGPVLTISRQYGCEANKLAIKILGKIAELNKGSITRSRWKYINKEIIDDAAKELHLKVDRIDKRFTDENIAVHDLFDSFSHHYSMNDKKIVNTIKNVLDTYITKGNLIIIGRGGAQFVQKIEDAIKIRLFAPVEWRVKKISESKKITIEQASELVEKMDQTRLRYSEKVSGIPYSDGLFDVGFNRKTVPEEQIVEMIISMMKSKKFI